MTIAKSQCYHPGPFRSMRAVGVLQVVVGVLQVVLFRGVVRVVVETLSFPLTRVSDGISSFIQ